LTAVNGEPQDERDADDLDAPSDDGQYTPYYVDHEPWTEYELADQLGSGDN
jgi:hypothetical protein